MNQNIRILNLSWYIESESIFNLQFQALDGFWYLLAQDEEKEIDEGLAQGRKIIECVTKGDVVSAPSESPSASDYPPCHCAI